MEEAMARTPTLSSYKYSPESLTASIDKFIKLCEKGEELPIIARFCFMNGMSKETMTKYHKKTHLLYPYIEPLYLYCEADIIKRAMTNKMNYGIARLVLGDYGIEDASSRLDRVLKEKELQLKYNISDDEDILQKLQKLNDKQLKALLDDE